MDGPLQKNCLNSNELSTETVKVFWALAFWQFKVENSDVSDIIRVIRDALVLYVLDLDSKSLDKRANPRWKLY